MEDIIKVVDLHKAYANHQVLKGVSFQIKKGETFALLGINGSGKTTLLSCIQQLCSFERGSIFMEDSYGVQLQSTTLPNEIKVKEAILLFSKWKNCEIDRKLWNSFKIASIANQRYHTLSTGQKRRVHLMLALLHNPEILFLDEPTAGLDVEARHDLHKEIQRLQKAGKTIVIASHDLQEVEALCNHIVILKDGHIEYDGDVTYIEKTKKATTIHLQVAKDLTLPMFSSITSYTYKDGWYQFICEDVVIAIYEIVAYFKHQKIQPSDIFIQRNHTLESFFLDIAKER